MNSQSKDFAAIVLAAGEGNRMKSPLSKVLHPIAGKPMVLRTIEILKRINPAQIILVGNPNNAKILKKIAPECDVVIQPFPRGTADATKYGLKQVKGGIATIAVLYGDDSAFYKPETITTVYQLYQKTNAKITFVSVKKEDSTGFGRIVRKNGNLIGIVEEKDATLEERSIKEVNASVYFFEKDWLIKNLSKISPSTITREYYITDLIGLAINQEEKVTNYQLKEDSQWYGVNTKEELKEAQDKFLKRIHIMGIAGSGASAVAGIAQGYGWEITGCDLNPVSSYSKNLKINIKKGHNPSHTQNIGMLIVSPAVSKLNPKNPEILHAQKLGIPVISWQKFQGKFLQKDKFVITVAGAYGKSTTAAMIAKILEDLGLDPTAEIGATMCQWGVNFRVGHSKYYVCEADEYNDNFLNYQSDIAVILNTTWDHPDYFKNKEQLLNSYQKFVANIKKNGTLVIAEGPTLGKLAQAARSDIKIIKVPQYGGYSLSIIGDFRKENANAALSVTKVLGLDLAKAKKSIKNFNGLGRRLEYKGEINGVKVYDDYAVQPHTTKTTANALKEKFMDKNIVLVFEPHTFSRIETFFDDFVLSLKNTKIDRVLITNVFPARERGDATDLAIKLAKSIGAKAKYTGSLEQTVNYLKSNSKDFDVILSMGAGDVYKLYDLLKEKSL